QAYDWKYAENFRQSGRFAIVSSARMQPTDYPGKWNRELLNSRLQKMVTKNLAILYFALPLSNDYTSLLSAGVLSGKQIDYMSEHLMGAKNRWAPMLDYGDPMVALDVTGQTSGMGPQLCGRAASRLSNGALFCRSFPGPIHTKEARFLPRWS